MKNLLLALTAALLLTGCGIIEFAQDVGDATMEVGFIATLAYLGSLISPFAAAAGAGLGWFGTDSANKKETIEKLEEKVDRLQTQNKVMEDAADLGTWISDNSTGILILAGVLLVAFWLMPSPKISNKTNKDN
jgi:hypothetical protein